MWGRQAVEQRRWQRWCCLQSLSGALRSPTCTHSSPAPARKRRSLRFGSCRLEGGVSARVAVRTHTRGALSLHGRKRFFVKPAAHGRRGSSDLTREALSQRHLAWRVTSVLNKAQQSRAAIYSQRWTGIKSVASSREEGSIAKGRHVHTLKWKNGRGRRAGADE